MSYKVNPLEKFLQGFAQVRPDEDIKDNTCPIQENTEKSEIKPSKD